MEPKGIVYTKRWVVDLLLNLSGYSSEKDLANTPAIEPAAGDGAFLGPMVERLVESCRNHGRPLSECQHSIIAYELNEKSAARSRAATDEILSNHGVARPLALQLAESWVQNSDYLFDGINQEADFIIHGRGSLLLGKKILVLIATAPGLNRPHADICRLISLWSDVGN